METTIDIDPKLAMEARAEKAALAANWPDNPWHGAAKRLEAAQKAARDQEKVNIAKAERNEGESLKESFGMHRGLCERMAELSREIDSLQATIDREAKQHLDSYAYWRRSPEGMSCEADYRTVILGANGKRELPTNHYLNLVGPAMAERMQKADHHQNELRNKLVVRDSHAAQKKMFEDRHPVLALISLEAVPA